MIECYQKIGDARVHAVYDRLARDFGEQSDVLTLARAYVQPRTSPREASGDRAIWTGQDVDMFGRVSPDGRLVSFVDWAGFGDLAIYDIASKTKRLLTSKTSWPDMENGSAGYSVFSSDSRQLAYEWQDDRQIGIWIASLTPDAATTSRRQLIAWNRADVRFMGAIDWSRDGRSIAVALNRTDGSTQIVVASVADGSSRLLKSVGWQGPERMFLSPDGKYLAYDLSDSQVSDQRDLYVMAVDGSHETTVAEHSTADESLIGWAVDGTQLLFTSNRNGSNGLWSIRMSGGKSGGTPELLRSDMGPGTFSLGLMASGAAAVYKIVSSREIRVQPIDLARATVTGPALTLPHGGAPGPQDPNWSPDGRFLAHQACRPLGSCLVIRNVETGEVRRLSNQQIGYTRDPRWSPDGSALVIGGRDPKGRDGIFRFDLKTGTVTTIAHRPNLGSAPRWSADGSKIYYDSRDANRRIVERDLQSGMERDVFIGAARNVEASPNGTELAITTQPDGNGIARLVLVPLSGGTPRELLRFSGDELLPQPHVLAWSPDARAILIARKSSGRVALWLVPINGAEARRLEIDVQDWTVSDPNAFQDGGFALSADGKRIAYIAGSYRVEVWAIENVVR
jgi:Tol biopolymer transport system component